MKHYIHEYADHLPNTDASEHPSLNTVGDLVESVSDQLAGQQPPATDDAFKPEDCGRLWYFDKFGQKTWYSDARPLPATDEQPKRWKIDIDGYPISSQHENGGWMNEEQRASTESDAKAAPATDDKQWTVGSWFIEGEGASWSVLREIENGSELVVADLSYAQARAIKDAHNAAIREL